MQRCMIIIPVLIAVLAVSVFPASGSIGGKVVREIVEETVERSMKRSSIELAEKTASNSASQTLKRLAKTYGTDVVKVVDDSGSKLLQAVQKYGDDVVEYAMKSSPQARRAFVQNIPEMLPLVRRVGVDALELEAKNPGLSLRVFKIFGDDAGKVLARNIPTEDVPRILRYAETTDSPATRDLLIETYKKEGRSLFERIPPRLVLATGLSTSMLYGTHQMTAPVRAIAEAIKEKPGLAETAGRQILVMATIIVLAIILILFWRFGLMPWHRKRPLVATTVLDETK